MHRLAQDRFYALPLAVLLAGALLFAGGCSDDDDGDGGNNPTDPGADDFTQDVAVTQAPLAGSMAVSMVQSLPAFAQGFAGKSAAKDYDYDFGWNEETSRWEATLDFDEEGYDYTWFYGVQFLDALGEPQQDAASAVSMNYIQRGTVAYNYNDGEGTSLVWNQDWDSDVTVTGLSLESFLMDGSGGYDMDYDVQSGDYSESMELAARWETLGDGVILSEGGCPVGTIRYVMDPYYLDVEFDGSSTATYTLYDANGTAVTGGSGTQELVCGR